MFIFKSICFIKNIFGKHKLLHLKFAFSSRLTWRDMQHLTVLTSKRNSLFDSKGRFHWTMNGVGLEFNHLFGFGVLDAGAMVALAKKWKSVPARYHCEAGFDKTVRYWYFYLFIEFDKYKLSPWSQMVIITIIIFIPITQEPEQDRLAKKSGSGWFE